MPLFGVQSGEMIWQRPTFGMPVFAKAPRAGEAGPCSATGNQMNEMHWLLHWLRCPTRFRRSLCVKSPGEWASSFQSIPVSPPSAQKQSLQLKLSMPVSWSRRGMTAQGYVKLAESCDCNTRRWRARTCSLPGTTQVPREQPPIASEITGRSCSAPEYPRTPAYGDGRRSRRGGTKRDPA